MAALNDHSFGIFAETTYGVAGAPDHFYEFLASSSLEYDPNVIYPKGLRTGSRFARASRAVGLVPIVGGKFEFEFASRSFGALLNAAFGTAAWTAITGGGQIVATATTTGSTLPTFTAQVGLVRADGTVIAHNLHGCTVQSCSFEQPLEGFLQLSLDVTGKAMHLTRTVSDGATTTDTATFTSATAAFAARDVGSPISATGIPAATTIIGVTNATTVTMSANATATGTSLATTIGTAYVTPTYATGATNYASTVNPSLANMVIGGTLTAPTTTALASIAGGTTVAALKSWKLDMNNGVEPRKAVGTVNQPTTGGRKGTIETELEFDATTGSLLENAMMNKTSMPILIQAETSEVIGSGYAAFQLVIPSASINKGAIPDPTEGGVASTKLQWEITDNEVATAQVYAVYRTADTAL